MDGSIIITTYNRPKFLKRAIESCINQTTDYDYEIIVVDDNGLDTPLQKETFKLVNKYNNIVYLPLEKNSGACTARNIGVENAKGEYIFFLDDDDEFLKERINIPIQFLNLNPEIDVFASGFKRLDSNFNSIISMSNFPIVGDFKNFAIRGNLFNTMVCIRRNVFNDVGGFIQIPRFQDRYLFLRMLEKKIRFHVEDIELCVVYEHNEARITNTSIFNTLTSLDIIKKFILKYKASFTYNEWVVFLANDLRMRAVVFYNSENFNNRIKAINFYFKTFKLSKNKSDLVMIIKSIIKIFIK